MKRTLSLLIALLILTTLTGCGSKINTITKDVNTKDGIYKNQTIILHTNDTHGAVEGFSYLPPLKKSLEDQGATVITVDAGDFTNGTIYVSLSKGESAITLMNQVGYDLVGLGNHEFDFGYDKLKENISKATFKTLCSNVFENNKTIFDSEVIIKVGNLKIGFFAIETPETLTKSNPDLVKGLSFPLNEEIFKIAQNEIDKLRKEADIVICIAHLGVDEESTGQRSYDLYNNVQGLDFIIDGHSHTVMIHGENGEPIQSTGTQFENIGVIQIDNETKKIVKNELVPTNDLKQDPEVLATAENIIQTVDDEYDKVFAISEVDLDGVKEHVRTAETNLGDLITDAMLWSGMNENQLKVDADHIVALTHGGGIRSSIENGNVSKKDILSVLPFGNTISINYVKGSELLELLEAATFMTPEPSGGFPQVSGIKYTIDTTKEYDAGELYPESTYFKPNSIKRVTIEEINGKPLNLDDTYAVITNNFSSAGGDSHYAFRESRLNGNAIDTPVTLDSAVINYITTVLGGVIGQEYKEPQGRIKVIVE